MRLMASVGAAAKKATDASGILALIFALTGGVLVSVPAHAENTTITVALCGTTTIQINRPSSDSVVPRADVPISGTVQNSNQIEIRVDDKFSGFIPVSGNTNVFDGAINLEKGTHTITLEATNNCGGPSAEASVVVSYLPSGSDDIGGGMIVGNQALVDEVDYKQSSVDILKFLTGPFEGIIKWLNIDDGTQTHGLAHMSLWRAIFATASLYLVLFSVSLTRREWLGGRWPFSSIFPSMNNEPRMKVIGLVVRVIGLIMLMGVLTF